MSAFDEGNGAVEFGYIDALAKEIATDECVRCSGRGGWKSAALLYEGLEWKYYYCYECRRWFVRHYLYRYAIAAVNDPDTIRRINQQLELQRAMFEASIESTSWIKKLFSPIGKIARKLNTKR